MSDIISKINDDLDEYAELCLYFGKKQKPMDKFYPHLTKLQIKLKKQKDK